MNPTTKRSLKLKTFFWTSDQPTALQDLVNAWYTDLTENPEATVVNIRYESQLTQSGNNVTGAVIVFITYTE